jgi:4'-phosphopantetheinyl transferase
MENPHKVEVWHCTLAEAPLLTQSVLSADEKERAARFRSNRDRWRFCTARSLLRHVLATYTHQDAAALHFDYSAYGKPTLRDYPHLYFNLAHAHEYIMLAVAKVAVGVDVEYRREVALEQLAARFFCKAEIAHLAQLPHAAKHKAFLRLWTCKEAYLKATGEGLRALSYACIELDAHDHVQIHDPRLSDTACWQLHELSLGEDYAAALAVNGRYDYEMRHFSWLNTATSR